MIVDCPNCSAQLEINVSSVQDPSARIQCTLCNSLFTLDTGVSQGLDSFIDLDLESPADVGLQRSAPEPIDDMTLELPTSGDAGEDPNTSHNPHLSDDAMGFAAPPPSTTPEGSGTTQRVQISHEPAGSEPTVFDLASMPELAAQKKEVRPASLSPIERLRRGHSPQSLDPSTATTTTLGARVGNGLVLLGASLVLITSLVFYVTDLTPQQIVTDASDQGRLRNAFVAPGDGIAGAHVTGMHAFLYPTDGGMSVLVLAGAVKNQSNATQENLYAVARLKDADDHVIATSRSPVGLPLSAQTISQLTDADTIGQAFNAAARANPTAQRLAPGAKADFTAIVLRPPRQLRELNPELEIVPGEPLLEPPTGEPAIVEEPPTPVSPKKRKRRGKRQKRGRRRR